MDVSDGEKEDFVAEEAVFKKPERKFMKYKPRKSIEIERELSMSDMEFVTSVQVDEECQDINLKTTLSSTTSQLSQASISLVKSFEISGVNPLESSVEMPRDYLSNVSDIKIPRDLNDSNFEVRLSNITAAKLGEKSVLICPEEHCRGTMRCTENSVLICRRCERYRDLNEEYVRPDIELSESLLNFQQNFQKPKFEVDFSVLDKFKNQPTFDEIFEKIDAFRSASTRSLNQGPFYDWLEKTKDKLKELSLPSVKDSSK